MASNLVIRDRTQTDNLRLNEIADLSFSGFLRYFAKQSLNSEDGHVLICQIGDDVAGFVKLIWFNIKGKKHGCVLWLATHSSFRRRGVALALVKAGTTYLKAANANSVFASIQKSNTASLATFHHYNYRTVKFGDLWKIFGWSIFKFYVSIWYLISEIVVMYP